MVGCTEGLTEDPAGPVVIYISHSEVPTHVDAHNPGHRRRCICPNVRAMPSCILSTHRSAHVCRHQRQRGDDFPVSFRQAPPVACVGWLLTSTIGGLTLDSSEIIAAHERRTVFRGRYVQFIIPQQLTYKRCCASNRRKS